MRTRPNPSAQEPLSPTLPPKEGKGAESLPSLGGGARRAEGATHKVAILIPAYNEGLTIYEQVTRIAKAHPTLFIVIIDNNSNDDTQEKARQALHDSGTNGTVLIEKAQGKGHAIRRAFLDINAQFYVMIDADLTYAIDDLPKLLEPVKSGQIDMAVGDRFSSGDYTRTNDRQFHTFGNRLTRFLINTFFNANLTDILSGYRVFNARFVKNFPNTSKGFEIETELTLHALDKQFRIQEIPTQYGQRPEGSVSKLNTVKDGLRVISTIVLIFKDYKPFLFFGWVSALLFISSWTVGIPVILEFIRFHYIFKVPSAVLAAGLMILSFLALAVGLILHTVVGHQRANYHLWLLRNPD